MPIRMVASAPTLRTSIVIEGMSSVHDAYFAIPDKPPVSAGVYPFHVRGSVYVRDHEGYAAVMTSAQLSDAIRQLPDASYQRFFEQRFVAAEWYDILPSIYLRIAAARTLGIPINMLMRDLTRHQVRHSMEGITGVLLKDVTAERVAAWVPKLAASYYDFGRVDASVVGPSVVRFLRFGVPRLAVRFWAITLSEFIESSLARSGAAEPHVSFLEVEKTGQERGYDVYRIPYEVAWRSNDG